MPDNGPVKIGTVDDSLSWTMSLADRIDRNWSYPRWNRSPSYDGLTPNYGLQTATSNRRFAHRSDRRCRPRSSRCRRASTRSPRCGRRTRVWLVAPYLLWLLAVTPGFRTRVDGLSMTLDRLADLLSTTQSTVRRWRSPRVWQLTPRSCGDRAGLCRGVVRTPPRTSPAEPCPCRPSAECRLRVVRSCAASSPRGLSPDLRVRLTTQGRPPSTSGSRSRRDTGYRSCRR